MPQDLFTKYLLLRMTFLRNELFRLKVKINYYRLLGREYESTLSELCDVKFRLFILSSESIDLTFWHAKFVTPTEFKIVVDVDNNNFINKVLKHRRNKNVVN